MICIHLSLLYSLFTSFEPFRPVYHTSLRDITQTSDGHLNFNKVHSSIVLCSVLISTFIYGGMSILTQNLILLYVNLMRKEVPKGKIFYKCKDNKY